MRKRNITKKVFALLMTFCMVAVYMPTFAFAAEQPAQNVKAEETAEPAAPDPDAVADETVKASKAAKKVKAQQADSEEEAVESEEPVASEEPTVTEEPEVSTTEPEEAEPAAEESAEEPAVTEEPAAEEQAEEAVPEETPEEEATENKPFDASKADYLSYDPLYVAKYANSKYVDVKNVDMLAYYKIVTAARGLATYNVKKQADFDVTEKNYIAGIPYQMPVYDVDPDSDYYIAIPDVNKFNPNFQDYDLILAYNNDYAETISGYHFEKGILYIPKSAVDNPKNSKPLNNEDMPISVQMNYAIGTDMDLSKTIPVQVLSDEEPVNKTVSSDNIFSDVSITVKTGVTGRSSDKIGVYLNGSLIPALDNSWTYDRSSGNLTVYASPGIVSNINIVFHKRDAVETAVDTATSAIEKTAPKASAAGRVDTKEMKYFKTDKGKRVTLDIPTEKLFIGWRGYYTGVKQHTHSDESNAHAAERLSKLNGWRDSIKYLYGGYDSNEYASSGGTFEAKNASAMWAFSSYAISYNMDPRSGHGGEIEKASQSINFWNNFEGQWENHTIYEWLLIYNTVLELSKNNNGVNSNGNQAPNGIGGVNNFGFTLPRKVTGAPTSLVSKGENAGKANTSFKIVSEELEAAEGNDDGSSYYDYYIAASCNHMGAAESDAGNQKNKIYMTCLDIGHDDVGDYAVFAFVSATDTKSQNACGVYKFAINAGYHMYLKKSAGNTAVLNHSGYSLEGAKYKVYTDQACTKEALNAEDKKFTLVTNSKGETQTVEMSEGQYYIKETDPSPGFLKDPEVHPAKITSANDEKNPFVVKSTEPPITPPVKVKKVASRADVLEHPEYSLAGAEYYLYTDAAMTKRATDINGKQVVLTTDKNGMTNEAKMFPGKYYVKEEKASPGFFIDENVNDGKVIELTMKNGNTPYVINSTEKPKKSHVTLIKKAADTDIDFLKEAPNNYSLEGAVYKVYTNIECTEQATDFNGKPVEFTTNAKGETPVIEMFPGTYYAKEIKASKGYMLDKRAAEVILTLDNTKENPGVFNSVEEPVYDNVKVMLEKTSEKYAAFRLAGAKYKLSYYDVDPATEVKDLPEATRSWTAEVKLSSSNGQSRAVLDFATDDFIGGSNEPYVENGKRILPCGVFTIQEIEAPKGLAQDKTIYKGEIKQPSNGVDAVTTFMNGETKIEDDFHGLYINFDERFKLTHLEDEQHVKLTVQKKDAETKKAEPSGHATLEGATYEVYFFDPELNKNVYVGKIVTDEKGYGEITNIAEDNGYTGTNHEKFKNKRLEPGTYSIKEIAAPKGYTVDALYYETQENDPETYKEGKHIISARSEEINVALFTFDVESLDLVHHTHINKTDITTGKELPGATLQVIDSEGHIVEEWVSTEESHDVVGLADGKYTLREITAPYGYDTAEDIEFEVKADKVENTVEMKNAPIEIKTTATDSETHTHMGKFSSEEKILDLVEYKNLYAGREYTMTGTLMDKKTGKALLDKEGKEVTGEKTFTPEGEKGQLVSGTVLIEFTVDASEFDKEKTVVAFEKVFRERRELAMHADLEDENQTIHYGGIAATTAVDKNSGSHNVLAAENTVVTDTVEYKNLAVGEEYLLEGELFDKTTGELTGIKSQATFKPEKSDGTTEVEFTFDASSFEGHTFVVFEKLSVIAKIEGKDTPVEIDKHENPDDEDQTIHIPKIRTTAEDSKTGEHIAYAEVNTVIRDTVIYENLIPGKEYTVKGKLVYKDNGNDVVVDGASVNAEAKFTPEEYNGEVVLEFNFNAVPVAGKKIVAFEEVYEEYLVGVHADLEDEEQTVYIPKIRTTAIDSKTKDHVASEGETITVFDTVKYEKLIPGKEYTMKGTLMNKETKKPLMYNGAEVTAEKKFTPENEDGEVVLEFKASPDDIRGGALVAFEECYYAEFLIADHRDITDEDQTVHVPEIRTTAVDSETKEHIANGDEDVTIIDRVFYKGLIPGKKYTVEGTLMNKSTGKAVTEGGAPVTQRKEFTPKKSEGSVDIEFTFDGTAIQGKTVVAFENMYFNDVLVAVHADLNDEDQSVYIPRIRTIAALVDKDVEDTIEYENLIPGRDYVARGWLVSTETGKKLSGSDGDFEFTADEADGSVEVTLPVAHYDKVKGLKLTAFEELYIIDEDGNEKLIAEHKDTEDNDQTVKIPGKRPKTGDNTAIYLFGGLFVLAVAALVFFRKKSAKKDEPEKDVKKDVKEE